MQKLHSVKPERGTENTPNRTYAMYVLKRDPELTGDVVTDAYATFDQMTNRPMVLMYMNSDGAERWAKSPVPTLANELRLYSMAKSIAHPLSEVKLPAAAPRSKEWQMSRKLSSSKLS